jgi:SsrA-binding protein
MPTLAQNKRATFDYEVLDKYTAGIELTGHETKSLKTKSGGLAGTHVIIRDDEAYLIGMQIPSFQPENAPKDYDSQRTRRLLLHKNEINNLLGKTQTGLTIVPLRVYDNAHGLIKVDIAVARGRKKHDKRELIKKREAVREIRKRI